MTTHNEPIIERTETHHWWVSPAYDRDIYLVYLVRYLDEPEYEREAQFFDVKQNDWISFRENELIPPVLILPGTLLNILSKEKVFNRGDIADSIKELCERIYAKTVEGQSSSELPKSDENVDT